MVKSSRLTIGQVVYFLERTGYNYQYQIHFGIVDDIFSDKVAVKRLTTKENRLIDGIPYDEFKTPTRWQKLPKDWTYNTELFKLTWDDAISEKHKDYRIDNPDDILAAIADGFLIYSNQKDWSHIEAEIDKHQGWRLIRKTDPGDWISFYSTFYYNELYYSYTEAQQQIDAYDNELKRQAALSDEEWSLEQIEKDVDRYLGLNYPDEEIRAERKERIMDWFRSMDHIDDIETRLSGQTIQWKYWKNKKWIDVDQNIL